MEIHHASQEDLIKHVDEESSAHMESIKNAACVPQHLHEDRRRTIKRISEESRGRRRPTEPRFSFHFLLFPPSPSFSFSASSQREALNTGGGEETFSAD